MLEILEIDPEDRSIEDIEDLENCLQYHKFFQMIKKQIRPAKYMRLFKHITIEFGTQFDRVIQAKTIGKNFYIVLSGSVTVLIPEKEGVKKDNKHLHHGKEKCSAIDEAILLDNPNF